MESNQLLNPCLLQVNTRVWLGELSARAGKPIGLADVSDQVLDELVGPGFDWLWLLGVWQTGWLGRVIAELVHGQELRESYGDLAESSICSSPFAITQYRVSEDLGGPAALRSFRRRLQTRGVRLMLDFVPNHTAVDHPWVAQHPEFYVQGSESALSTQPQNFVRLGQGGGRVMAYGRDPYFDGWSDTLQLNYRHAGLRSAMSQVLQDIAGQCDGVRCDMAMLVDPDVFLRTWGELSVPADGSAAQDEPFWPMAIAQVHETSPDFLFMAEVYWDLEWRLQQQGFDYTYDKRLFDRLATRQARAVRDHLKADLAYQRQLTRFLENHDEPRAATTFDADMHKAAAIITFLVPGMRFFHEGQFDGRRVRVPMQLARRPSEPRNEATRSFYTNLLELLQQDVVRRGTWQLLECHAAWPDNPTWDNFLAFCWSQGAERLLVIVNYGPTQGQCYVPIPWEDWRSKQIMLHDLLGPARYRRDGTDLISQGLFVDMPAWGYHVFRG